MTIQWTHNRTAVSGSRLWLSGRWCAVIAACAVIGTSLGGVATAAPISPVVAAPATTASGPAPVNVMSFNLTACAFTESGSAHKKCDGDLGRAKHLDDIVNNTPNPRDANSSVSFDFIATQEADLLTDRSPRTSGLLFQGARQGDGTRPCIQASPVLHPAYERFSPPLANGMCINFGSPKNTVEEPTTLVKLLYNSKSWELDTAPYYRIIGQDRHGPDTYRRVAGIVHFTHKSPAGVDGKGIYVLDTHWPTDGAGNREETLRLISSYKEVYKSIVKRDDPIIFMGDFNHEFITYNTGKPVAVEDFSPTDPGFFRNANAEQLAGRREKTFHNFTYEFTEPLLNVNPRMIDFIFYTFPLALQHAEILHSPAQGNRDTSYGLASDHFPVMATLFLP
ncbi:hypothetical protein [Rhodococcus jostii]|uniref:hypothetical protein n=1 Tax=Rhodococcus jostii TaxID=132919 RepID=UPI00363D3BBF